VGAVMKILDIWNEWTSDNDFSGIISIMDEHNIIFEQCCGFRNINEKLPNNRHTAFGIASGTKLFTGLAICKLIDEGKLSLDDRVWDLLPFDLGKIPKEVNILHLLTHTSGIGDYIDEETPNSYEQLKQLYDNYPVYRWESLEYYLPMTTYLEPKFEVGSRFGYSNSGFVILGLVIEAVSHLSYQQYVVENIIKKCGLKHTGFYRSDNLPENSAYGYIYDSNTDEWRTNIFYMPVIGGADGGLFTCVDDINFLWRIVMADGLFSNDMKNTFLKQHVKMNNNQEDNRYYGLGVYIRNYENNPQYYAVGGDFGVEFFSVYFPKSQIVTSVLANTESNISSLFKQLLEKIERY